MNQPFITVIIPIRNEENFITACLQTVLEQDYPSDQIEILVIDGMSDDGTRDIVSQIAKDAPRIRLLDNPKRIAPTALNIGIKQAQGDIIIRVDGHCEIAPNYVSECVALLQARNVACVGGIIETIGLGLTGEAISIAQSSLFGVGGARFRNPDTLQEHFVDTLAFGAYRAHLFQEIGLFDEELVRNQDDELNFRLIQAGHCILLSPRIRAVYYSRATWSKLWRQYYQYGYWKVRVMQKRGGVAAWRHVIPGSLVIATLASILLSLVTRQRWWAIGIIGPYMLANLAASLMTAASKGWRYLIYLPVSFAILHWAYGLGFLTGIRDFVLRPGKVTSHE